MNLVGKMKFTGIVILLFGLIILYSCKEASTEPEDSPGSLVVRITDAPFPIEQIEEANVVINRIEIKDSEMKGKEAYLTVSEEIISLNLMNLRNGITQNLPARDIPTGLYDQVRLYVEDASIVLTDGRQFDLNVPNGAKKGIQIKIKPAIFIERGLTSELLLDVDLSKSFKVKGNPDEPDGIEGFEFKPKIRAVSKSMTGSLSGYVRDSKYKKLQNAEVTVRRDTVVSRTFTDKKGRYALIGLPPGIYIVDAAKPGYLGVTMTDVDIIEGNETIRDFMLNKE